MKQTDKKVPLTRIIIVVLLFILIASSVLFVISLWEKQYDEYNGVSPDDPSASKIEFDGEEYAINKNVETVLVMGLDKFEKDADDSDYTNNQQADFLMLLILDNQSKTCKALQLNRDTMADMNVLGVAGMEIGTVKQQLALSHTYGNGQNVSCRNTVKAVSNLLLGMKIDHYVSLTMDAVPVFNDLVGGVTIEVLDDFTGIDDALVKGERVTLNGENALAYIRARQGLDDSTNEHRMVRQRQYIDALYKETLDKANSDGDFILDAINRISDYMISDCSAADLQELFEKISGYDFSGTKTLEGKSEVGERFMEFYPDETSLKRVVIDLYYTKSN